MQSVRSIMKQLSWSGLVARFCLGFPSQNRDVQAKPAYTQRQGAGGRR